MSALCSGLTDLLLFISDSIDPYFRCFIYWHFVFGTFEKKKKNNPHLPSVWGEEEKKRKQKLAFSDGEQQLEVDWLPPSPNYSQDLSRAPCQRWPRTDPIWPLAHTRQLLVLVPVKRRSMRPALIVIISDRLPGTISNPHHLSCRQVHRCGKGALASSAAQPCCGSRTHLQTHSKKQKGQWMQCINIL